MGAFENLRASLSPDELDGMVVDPSTGSLSLATAPGGRLSVGPSAPVPAYVPPQALSTPQGRDVAPTGIVSGPAPVDEGAKSRADLIAAQRRADLDSYTSRVGASLSDAGSIIRGDGRHATPADASLTDRPVQNILTQQTQTKEAIAEAARKAANDLDSPVSQRATMLAQATGLIKPGQRITAAQYQEAVEGRKTQVTSETAAANTAQAKAALEQQRMDALLAHQDRMGEQGVQMFAHKTAAQEAAERLAEERRYHDMEMEKAREAAARASNKPVPEQEATKLVNQGQTPEAIKKLKELHDKIGLSGYIPFVNLGASGRYEDAVNALAPAVSAGAAPNARENAGLMEEFKKGLPKPWHSDGRAEQAFQELSDATAKNREAQVNALRGGGYNQKQIEELDRQAQGGSGKGPPGGHMTVQQNGHTYTWNASRGSYE